MIYPVNEYQARVAEAAGVYRCATDHEELVRELPRRGMGLSGQGQLLVQAGSAAIEQTQAAPSETPVPSFTNSLAWNAAGAVRWLDDISRPAMD